MPAVSFSHPIVGNLTIDNGIDDAQWAYGLNSVTIPTYGGEVVQILSVYIDDLTLTGTCATYQQIEAIYAYFGSYLQVATQGTKPVPNIADAIGGTAYNLQPVTFSYPHRDWQFRLYPKGVPGFRYALDVVTPTWELTAHVIDDTPDLNLIKDGLKALAASKLPDGTTIALNGEISPGIGNPDTDPFETFTSNTAQQQQVINKYADYFNSLIPAYQKGDFAALTGAIGAKPNFPGAGIQSGQSSNQAGTQTQTATPRRSTSTAQTPAQQMRNTAKGL